MMETAESNSKEVCSLYGTAHLLKMEVLINRLMMIHKYMYIIAVCIDGQERGQGGGGGGGEEHLGGETGETVIFYTLYSRMYTLCTVEDRK